MSGAKACFAATPCIWAVPGSLVGEARGRRRFGAPGRTVRRAMLALCCIGLMAGCESVDFDGRYDSVITIDATDGVSAEELALYHDYPRDTLVFRRLVKIIVDPRMGVFDLGPFTIGRNSRVRVFSQTIIIRFEPKLRLRSEMTFNDVVLDARTVRKINLEIRMAHSS